jgi:hypothetical protein
VLVIAITQAIYSQGTFETVISASDATNNDKFGAAVSIYSKYPLIGESNDDDLGSNSGSAYIFELDIDGWGEKR